MNDYYYTIYKLTSPSGKVYIGQTKQQPELRWKNGHGYSKSSAIYNSINKYGWDNIKKEILFSNLNKISADCIEMDLIYYYKSLGISLNISNGGEGNFGYKHSKYTKYKMSIVKQGKYCGMNNPNYGKKHSTEAKLKMREKALGRKLSIKSRIKISINNARYMLGKHHSEDTIMKMSKSHKGLKQSKESLYKRSLSMKGKNSKIVLLYTLDGAFIKEFSSGVECSKYLNVTTSTISGCLVGKRKSIKRKYIVRYGIDGNY